TAVERNRAADDVGPAAETPPERGRENGARVIGEPVTEKRGSQLPRQGRRDACAENELRLAGRRRMAASRKAEPPQDAEARGLLVVVRELGRGHSEEDAWLRRLRAEDRDEALAAGVRERAEQHTVDHSKYRRGRADAEGECDDGEHGDGRRRFPGGPRVGEGR